MRNRGLEGVVEGMIERRRVNARAGRDGDGGTDIKHQKVSEL